MDPRPNKRRKIVQEQRIEGTILQLNYDCLRYIFSYLTVRDMLHMEGIHKRFKDLAQDLYKTQRELDFSKLIHPRREYLGFTFISAAEAEKIFRRVGPYVETLKLSRNEIDGFAGINPLRFIWKYCKNLKAVYFNNIDFRRDGYAIKLAPVFKDVTNVHMINSNVLTDYKLETMFKLHKLKVLEVSNDYGKYDHNRLEGYFFKGLQDIEELSLRHSKTLDPREISVFFESNRTLRSLNINQCSAVNGECLSSIATNLVNLESLKFSIGDFPQDCYLALMDLPKLKDLTIYHHSYEYVVYDWDIGLLISILAAHNRLECLSIHFSGIDVTPETWSAIRSFTNLKKLGIRDVDFGPHMELLGMSSANTLEELDVSNTDISNLGMEILVKNFKNIRTIKAKSCSNLTNGFISNIMNHLAERRHKLTIIGWIPQSLGIPDYNPVPDLIEFVKD